MWGLVDTEAELLSVGREAGLLLAVGRGAELLAVGREDLTINFSKYLSR